MGTGMNKNPTNPSTVPPDPIPILLHNGGPVSGIAAAAKFLILVFAASALAA